MVESDAAQDIPSKTTDALVEFDMESREQSPAHRSTHLSSSASLDSRVEASLSRLPGHTHCLNLNLDEDPSLWNTSDTSNDISTYFRETQSLKLSHKKPGSLEESWYFKISPDNLTSLVIYGSVADVGVLHSFIWMFPNLDNLELRRVRMTGHMPKSPSPTTTPRFQGKLTLKDIRCDGPCVIDIFAGGRLAFNDLCVDGSRFKEPQSLKDLFVACKEKVKRLKLTVAYFKPTSGSFHQRLYALKTLFFQYLLDVSDQTPPVDLSPFEHLEELELYISFANWSVDYDERLLQTVSSNRVRKIIFDLGTPNSILHPNWHEIDTSVWSRLDDALLRVAEKTATGEKLKIVFRYCYTQPVPEAHHFITLNLKKCQTEATIDFEQT